METALPLFPVGLASVFFLLLWKVWHWVWLKPRLLERQLRQQGFRGNSYRLLVGDLKEAVNTMRAAWSRPMELTHRILPRASPFQHLILQRYGKKSFVWMGTTPGVIIWDAELGKEIMSSKSGHIKKPPTNPLVKLLATGVAILEGEEWAKRRKLITPAFHLEKLKGMVPAFTTSCSNLVEKWRELVVSAEGTYELDVWPEFQNLTGDVISRVAFGSSYEEGKKIFELQKEQALLAIDASCSVYFPGLKFLPTAKNRRRMFIYKENKAILTDMIKKKLDSMRTGVVSNDLLSLLLQSIDHGMTVEDVIEECKLFYFAGQETTSVLLTWTLIALSMHQDCQQKAREEVLRICDNRTPDFESINQLRIVNMILHEVLRLYPPLLTLLRHTVKKTELGDFILPAGVNLLVPALVLHHDAEIWGEDAEEFNPERFSEGVSKASKGQNAFFPFGWGPRICLGQNFAMIEAKLALAMILQHFSFELSPSYTHAPYTVILLQPQHGAHIVLHQL